MVAAGRLDRRRFKRRETLVHQRLPENSDRLWPKTVKLEEFRFAGARCLIQPGISRAEQRPDRWLRNALREWSEVGCLFHGWLPSRTP